MTLIQRGGTTIHGRSTGRKISAFRRFANLTARCVGSPAAFAVAVMAIIAWALTGPVFHYSDTWQLVVNTATSVITFVMVFLIQHTQNRETTAINMKLDELIRAVDGARNRLVRLEEMSDEELAILEEEFRKMRERHNPGSGQE